MSKTVAILQSNYIPWKGYFDIIRQVDEFILYDDVQYTKNDWRNRNQIKTPQGRQWITIPVLMSGKFGQRIDETHIANAQWASKHFKGLEQSYGRCDYFSLYHDELAALYDAAKTEPLLSRINHRFITAICQWLGITTTITWSTDYALSEGLDKNDRLIALLQQTGATSYLSGPSGQNYIDETSFSKAGIALRYAAYRYPTYPQPYPPFEHGVTVLDLLFNTGQDAPKYLEQVT